MMNNKNLLLLYGLLIFCLTSSPLKALRPRGETHEQYKQRILKKAAERPDKFTTAAIQKKLAASLALDAKKAKQTKTKRSSKRNGRVAPEPLPEPSTGGFALPASPDISYAYTTHTLPTAAARRPFIPNEHEEYSTSQSPFTEEGRRPFQHHSLAASPYDEEHMTGLTPDGRRFFTEEDELTAAQAAKRKKWKIGLGVGAGLAAIAGITTAAALESQKVDRLKDTIATQQATINSTSPEHYAAQTQTLADKTTVLNGGVATMNALSISAGASSTAAITAKSAASTAATAAGAAASTTPPDVTAATTQASTAQTQAVIATANATNAKESLDKINVLAATVTKQATDATTAADDTIREATAITTQLNGVIEAARTAKTAATTAKTTITTTQGIATGYVTTTQSASDAAATAASLASQHASNAQQIAANAANGTSTPLPFPAIYIAPHP